MMGEQEGLVAELLAALQMARSRFADLATVIRQDGSYDNAGFMEASAERLDAAIAKAEAALSAS